MSFQGYTAPLLMGPEGLTGTKNLSQVQAGQLIKAMTVTFENGTMQKEGGASKYNSSPISGSPSVIGGWDWWPTPPVQRMVVYTSAGAVLKDDGGGTFATTLVSGLQAGIQPVFVEAGKEVAANNRKLFLFNQKDRVRVLSADGVAMTVITTPPADWSVSDNSVNQPWFGVVHEDRLWGAGNENDPHRAYYSMETNHEDFTGAGSGSLPIFSGVGIRLVGGLSFKGLLILWKYPNGIFAVDTSDPTPANWRVTQISKEIGAAGFHSIVQIDNDVIWIDSGWNVQSIAAVQEFGDLGSVNVSESSQMGPFINSNVNLVKLMNVRGVYYLNKRAIHYAVAGAGDTLNTRRLVLDLKRLDRPPRFRWSDRDTCESVWLRLDSNNIARPMVGDNAGTVWQLDKDARDKGGAGYTCEFQLPHDDFGRLDTKLKTVWKYGKFLEIIVEPKGNWNVTADIYWDGKLKHSVQFNMGTTGSTIGTFIIGTDSLGGDQVTKRKRRIFGGGDRFSVGFRNGGVGEDFSIAEGLLHFVPGGEKVRA